MLSWKKKSYLFFCKDKSEGADILYLVNIYKERQDYECLPLAVTSEGALCRSRVWGGSIKAIGRITALLLQYSNQNIEMNIKISELWPQQRDCNMFYIILSYTVLFYIYVSLPKFDLLIFLCGIAKYVKDKTLGRKLNLWTIFSVNNYFMCVTWVQLCPTLCDPMDCSPPGSSDPGIFQARILEWVAISYSRVSSWPRDQTCMTCVSCIAGKFFTHWATQEELLYGMA